MRRLRARIVKALQEGRWGKVKALVYLLTHSFGGRALAILRVVSNSGARTPGIDQQRWNTPEAKAAAFDTLTRRGYQDWRSASAPRGCGGNGTKSTWFAMRMTSSSPARQRRCCAMKSDLS